MLSGNFSINAQTNWNDAKHFFVWFWNVITLVSLQHLVFFLWVRFEFFIRLLRELCRLWRKLIQLILLLRFDKFFHYIMNSCCFVISYCLLHFLRSKEKSWIVTLSSLWMGHAMYFSLGNSNSLASVDISAGYVGLEDFVPSIMVPLTYVATYCGPCLWLMAGILSVIRNAWDEARYVKLLTHQFTWQEIKDFYPVILRKKIRE